MPPPPSLDCMTAHMHNLHCTFSPALFLWGPPGRVCSDFRFQCLTERSSPTVNIIELSQDRLRIVLHSKVLPVPFPPISREGPSHDWVRITVRYRFLSKATLRPCLTPHVSHSLTVYRVLRALFHSPCAEIASKLVCWWQEGKRRQNGGMNNSQGPFWKKDLMYGGRLSFVRREWKLKPPQERRRYLQ